MFARCGHQEDRILMSKKIVIIFACLLLVLLPTILLSAVFIVRNIDVVGIGDEFVFDQEKIVGDSLLTTGSSIFVLSEKHATHNIELHNPEIEVVHIERIFPNKVVINISRRIPIAAVSVSGTSKYALVDRSMRVIKIVDSILDYNVIDFGEYELIIDKDTNLDGTIVTLDNSELKTYVLEGVIKGFESAGYTKDTIPSVVERLSIVDNKSVRIKMHTGASIEVFMNATGVSIEDMTRAGFGVFLADKNSTDKTAQERTKSGIYYFDTTLASGAGAWSHRD